MDRNRWLLFAGVCIAAVAGLVAMSGGEKIDVSNVDPSQITTDREINDNVYGSKDAKVVVFEYADFQCPGCAGAFQNVRSIKETYKDSVAFVYRHFPLMSAHPHAFAAAAASEAAGLQGKFWEMHDSIYETQDSWSSLSAAERQTTFEQYAANIGLDVEKYNTDLTSKAVANKVSFDRALGTKQSVDSTPSFFLNGEKVSSDIVTDLIQQRGEQFTALLDKAIKDAGGQPPQQADTATER